MANVLVESQSLTDIANAIRDKLNTQARYKPSDMAQAIENIPSGGASPRSEGEGFFIDAAGKQEWLSEVSSQIAPFNGEYYLESDGTAYIDTGYIVKDNTKVVARVIVSAPSQRQYATLFGVRDSSSSGLFCVTFRRAGYADAGRGWGSNYNYPFSTDNLFNQGITVTMQKGLLEIESLITDNKTYTREDSGSPSQDYTLFIYQMNSAGSTSGYNFGCPMKLFELFIFEGDTLVHHYTPDLDGDSIPCLYDSIDERYLYNSASSGSLTYGIYGRH